RQERDVVDDDGVRRGGLLQLRHARADLGVDDPVEDLELLGIGEDDRAEPRPVEGAVGPQHLVAERLDDLGEPGGARLDDLACDLVGVDHDRAALGEPAGHLALAGTDSAGETDLQHARSIPIAQRSQRRWTRVRWSATRSRLVSRYPSLR